MSEKKNPLQNWIKTTLELVAAVANEVKGLEESKKPAEAMQTLARSFDKLAVRCATQAIHTKEGETPQPINPLVEITAINLASGLRATARDLEHGKGTPKAWEETDKHLKAYSKVSAAVQLIISQTGVAGTVVMPGEPLKGEDGQPLVPPQD